VGYEEPGFDTLLDGKALRHELTALAQDARDSKLRKAALVVIKQRFSDARLCVKAEVESGAWDGVRAAQALSHIQDTLIQVLYDFATKHIYYAQNPTTAERIAIVATGGYGRAMLAPGSDVDLLFVRPFKETAWGESVIEFILHMLWDLGLKVGHATRSLAECIRLSRQDITIRTALLEARYLWGDRELHEELRRKFWADVAARSGQDFVESKLAERDHRHLQQGESRYPRRAQYQGRQGRLEGPADPLLDRKVSLSRRGCGPISSNTVCLPARNTAPSSMPRPSCGTSACICTIWWAAPRSASRSMPSPNSPNASASKATPSAARSRPSCAPTSWWPRTSAT
jgi:hypothetical protein